MIFYATTHASAEHFRRWVCKEIDDVDIFFLDPIFEIDCGAEGVEAMINVKLLLNFVQFANELCCVFIRALSREIGTVLILDIFGTIKRNLNRCGYSTRKDLSRNAYSSIRDVGAVRRCAKLEIISCAIIHKQL